MLAASPCTASICGTDGRLDIAGTFYLPATVTLYDRDGTAIDRYEPTADVAHQGLRYEAADAARCVTGGATESPLHPPATTLRIMEAMDEVRRQLGVHFPDK
jgi:predicted dehydrogenase